MAINIGGNTLSVTEHQLMGTGVRHVRLEVTTPEGCCGTGAARIYGVEVYAE